MPKKEVDPEFRCSLNSVHHCQYRSFENHCLLVVDWGHAKCSCDYRYEATVLEEFIPEEDVSFTEPTCMNTNANEDLLF